MSRFCALPQNMNEKEFEAAVRDFQLLLGNANVQIDREHIDQYIQSLPVVRRHDHTPSAVVYPGRVEDVQALVRLANKHRTPLWPVYTSENFGYGSAAPATRGQVILDLKRMNKILEVDPLLAYARVEPGVTYADMRRYLEENNIPLWIDRPPSALGSPAGNVVERNGGYTAYVDTYFFSCGMEVVMPDGDIVRTGMGGFPGSSGWQVFKWGIGPSIDGLFSQGNMGIVTKMGFWMMPKPSGYKPFLMTFPQKEMVGDIAATARSLRMVNLIQSACVISTAEQEAALRRRYSGPGAQAHKHDVGALNLTGAIYGSTAEVVPLMWNYVSGAFKARFGNRVKIYLEEDMGDDIAFAYRKQLMRGELQLQANSDDPGSGMQFSVIGPARAQDCNKQMALAEEVLGRYGIDYRAEMVISWRCFTHGIDLSFNHDDPEQVERTYACYGDLLRTFAANGYGVDRTHVDFMKQVADTYGPEIQAVWHTVKQSLDPNNIIAPGKSGIGL